jgi:methylmalonyl-CoA mutase N-terminal domain/subunit
VFSQEDLEKVRKLEEEWAKQVEGKYEKGSNFKLPEYATESRIPIKYVYTPLDARDMEIEVPGSYPYTRGLRPLTYQHTPWMIQMLHGYGTSEETRQRTEYLLKEGMAGYGGQPVALIQVDPPTTCGYEPDDPQVKYVVGLSGVSISTLEDLERLLGGYDLSKARVAPNTRFTCLPMLAMLIVYAESRGYKPSELNGQSQNDPLTRWITTDIGAPTPQTQQKLRVELIKYTTQNIPRWNHTNLCGYLYGETCATPAQELGIVMAQAIELIEDCIKANLQPDEFIPRFSSQVHMGMDFFEEVAKLRAWRRLWAKIMRERFNCQDPRSLQYRIHVHTGGSALTQEQPLNNIARTMLQVLASVLGGVQSLHTSSYDEAIGLPSEEAVRTAIRVNQIILHESGVAKVTDPLGGSYYIETLTNQIEEEAKKIIGEIEKRGGFIKCVENGWLRSLLENEMIKWRREIDSGEKIIVGLNKFKVEEKQEVPPFTIDLEEMKRITIERLKKWKAGRDNDLVKRTLVEVKEKMVKYEKIEQAGILMPALLNAARAKCTLAEMMEAIVEVTGGRVYSASYKM